tara:strand:+ start:2751 stop:3032 length:282 start_codon:yes stop_codon:yes gene_type:complete
MENQKLTEQELQTIKELQQKNNAVVAELGQIELTRMSVEARRANAESYLTDLRKEEEDFGKELSDKYGTGSIDLESGEFVPTPTEEATEAAAE